MMMVRGPWWWRRFIIIQPGVVSLSSSVMLIIISERWPPPPPPPPAEAAAGNRERACSSGDETEKSGGQQPTGCCCAAPPRRSAGRDEPRPQQLAGTPPQPAAAGRGPLPAAAWHNSCAVLPSYAPSASISASTSALPGRLGIAPSRCTQMHAAADANRSASCGALPSRKATEYAAVKQSPAPVVSTTFSARSAACRTGSLPSESCVATTGMNQDSVRPGSRNRSCARRLAQATRHAGGVTSHQERAVGAKLHKHVPHPLQYAANRLASSPRTPAARSSTHAARQRRRRVTSHPQRGGAGTRHRTSPCSFAAATLTRSRETFPPWLVGRPVRRACARVPARRGGGDALSRHDTLYLVSAGSKGVVSPFAQARFRWG